MRAIDRGFLATTAVFGGLPEHALTAFADVMRIVEVEAGAALFSEGEPARCMYVVHGGRLEIWKQRPSVRLSTLQRGDCIGEMSLIEIQPRSATARALGPASVYALDHAEIARLYQSSLEVYTLLVMNIARELSRRLRRADQRLMSLEAASAADDDVSRTR
jgi:CRP-like cAMP-binding protein